MSLDDVEEVGRHIHVYPRQFKIERLPLHVVVERKGRGHLKANLWPGLPESPLPHPRHVYLLRFSVGR